MNSPTSFVSEAIAQSPYVVADGSPFCPADDANVLDGQDGEEEIFVGSIVPVLIHLDEYRWLTEYPV